MADNTIFQDLLNAQKEIEAVDKDGKNPFFKSDYTTLNSTIEACKSVLNKHNLLVLQPIESDENGVYVCTTIYHTSGQSITSKMHIRESKNNDPQAQGSAITYARRYSLKSLLCMSDVDDDAEKATQQIREDDDKSTCPVHNVKMTEYEKEGRKFFAHKHADKWCNGKGVR